MSRNYKSFGGNKSVRVARRGASEFAAERVTNRVFQTNAITPSKQLPEDYVKSLLAPHIYKGTKIPDMSCYPSTTFCEEEHHTWAPFGADIANSGDLFGVGLKPGLTYNVMTSRAAIGTHSGMTIGAVCRQGQFINTDFSARYRAARLVSASATATYIGNGDTNRGTITAVFVPFGKNYVNFINPMTPGTTPSLMSDSSIDTIKDNLESYQGPLKYGASVFYKPTDPLSLRYVTCQLPQQLSQYCCVSTTDGKTVTSGGNAFNLASTLATGYGYFMFAVDNFDDSAKGNCLFDVKIVANWEAIPLDDDTDAIVESSPVNNNAASAGFSVASSTSAAGPQSAVGERTAIARSIISKHLKVSRKRKRT